jgi:hypothetical protein
MQIILRPLIIIGRPKEMGCVSAALPNQTTILKLRIMESQYQDINIIVEFGSIHG